jgi:predicted DNA-binding WGR domain protein
MKTFFYTGSNDANVSGMSSKVWKINRAGRTVTTWWGAINLVKRRIVRVGVLQSKSRTFRTLDDAIAHEGERIRKKEAKGYETTPRRRR